MEMRNKPQWLIFNEAPKICNMVVLLAVRPKSADTRRRKCEGDQQARLTIMIHF